MTMQTLIEHLIHQFRQLPYCSHVYFFNNRYLKIFSHYGDLCVALTNDDIAALKSSLGHLAITVTSLYNRTGVRLLADDNDKTHTSLCHSFANKDDINNYVLCYLYSDLNALLGRRLNSLELLLHPLSNLAEFHQLTLKDCADRAFNEIFNEIKQKQDHMADLRDLTKTNSISIKSLGGLLSESNTPQKMKQLIDQIFQWAKGNNPRFAIGDTSLKQTLTLMGWYGKLCNAILQNNRNEVENAMGMVFLLNVTLLSQVHSNTVFDVNFYSRLNHRKPPEKQQEVVIFLPDGLFHYISHIHHTIDEISRITPKKRIEDDEMATAHYYGIEFALYFAEVVAQYYGTTVYDCLESAYNKAKFFNADCLLPNLGIINISSAITHKNH